MYENCKRTLTTFPMEKCDTNLLPLIDCLDREKIRDLTPDELLNEYSENVWPPCNNSKIAIINELVKSILSVHLKKTINFKNISQRAITNNFTNFIDKKEFLFCYWQNYGMYPHYITKLDLSSKEIIFDTISRLVVRCIPL